jgi:hypothetical protein
MIETADGRRIDSRRFGEFAHGFAVTSHASQSKTVEHVVVAGRALDRQGGLRRVFARPGVLRRAYARQGRLAGPAAEREPGGRLDFSGRTIHLPGKLSTGPWPGPRPLAAGPRCSRRPCAKSPSACGAGSMSASKPNGRKRRTAGTIISAIRPTLPTVARPGTMKKRSLVGSGDHQPNFFAISLGLEMTTVAT